MEETKDGFVLDCSVTMAWCFDDEATPYTDSIRDKLSDVRLVVPTLWPIEVANATIVGERRKRLDEARGTRFLSLLSRLLAPQLWGSTQPRPTLSLITCLTQRACFFSPGTMI
jgi:predicted nucleic acid-binding protein